MTVSTPRALASQERVREAIHALRDTVMEDRKQMMYRVAFFGGLVAYVAALFLTLVIG